MMDGDGEGVEIKGSDGKGDEGEEEEESDSDEDDVQIHIGPIDTQTAPFYQGRLPSTSSMLSFGEHVHDMYNYNQ